MSDAEKTRAELLEELQTLRARIHELEQAQSHDPAAERMQRVNALKTRSIIDRSPDGIVLTNESGHIVEWSPGLEQITGILAAEALDSLIWDVFSRLFPDDIRDDDLHTMLREEYEQTFADGITRQDHQDFEIQLASGERRIVQQRSFTIGNNGQGYCFGAIIRDMTEVRHALRALRESESRYRTLFEQSPAALWEEDLSQAKLYLDQLRADGVTNFRQYFGDHPDEIAKCMNLVRVLDVNQATLDLTRAARKSDVFRGWNKPLSPEEIDLVREQMVAIAEGRSVFTGEGWGRALTDEPVSISVRWNAVSGHERTLSKVIVSITDTTQQHRINTDNERLILDLNAFAHTVAHDLKNPLGGITGYASLLVNNLENFSSEDVRRYLSLIERDGHKMSSIIDELLVLSSVRNLDEIERAPLDMLYIIASTMSRLGYLIEEYNAEVILPLNELPTAMGYASWVEEIWANYISNAIKYGGAPPRIWVGGERVNGRTARFWVRDNGDGLSPEEQAQLFAPFIRLEQAQTEGHGLGLSIVRRIIERLNGTVGVESKPGTGSLFYFTLPVETPAPTP